MLVGAVVRHKTEGNKLDVAPIKRDRKITQQPDGRSPIHGMERGEKPERGKTTVRTGRGENTTTLYAGLDGDNVPHSFFGYRGGLGAVPLQRDRRRRQRRGPFSGLMWGSRGRNGDWSRRRGLSRPLSCLLAESNREFSFTHLIHATADTLHQPLRASEHLFQTRLFLAEVHEMLLEFSV